MKNEMLDEALEMVRAAGFEPSLVRGRHWKISWADQRGRTRMLVVSFWPSDQLSRVRSRATLRKLLTSTCE